MLSVLKQSFRDFLDDEAPVRAAALAYYTVFALPPLLVLLVTVAGIVWDPADVQRAMESQFASLLGREGGQAIHGMIASADQPGGRSLWKTLLGVVGLIVGATGAFLQLQGALNRAWEVKPDPERGGLKNFVMKRFLSLGMILGVGFLIAVSLALSALLGVAGERLGAGFPDGILKVANAAVSFAVLALLLGAIFKVLPDAVIGWKDVAVGAIATALLFVAGKFAIGLYLGQSDPGDAFGAAGALAVILVWVYYAGMIVLFGAEFTQAWTRSRGRSIRPEEGAIRMEREGRRRAAGRGRAPAQAPDRPPLTLSQGSASMQRDVTRRGSAAPRPSPADGNGLSHDSVGELLKQLSSDSTHLFRQELNLARLELKASVSQYVRGARNLGIAAGIAIPGLLAFTAFVIVALGDLMNGNYWLSALIVSVVMLAVAGVLARKGIAAFGQASLVPEETAGTLREDADWAKHESQEFKRAVTAPHTRMH